MAHGRVWLGVGLLLATAGAAVAQPVYPGGGGTAAPPSAFMPAMPPMPSTLPQPMPGPDIKTLSGAADELPPVKELPGGLPELIPAPDRHHGACGGHEIDGFMTPFIPAHGGWYSQAEFLLQRPRNSDLDFAFVNSTTGLGTVGPLESLKYELGTGVRAEVGYRYGEGKWETAFAYTYLTAGTDRTLNAGPGQVLLPTLTRPGLTDRALTALGNLDLDYQTFDMLIARRTLVDEHFGVRWIGGFRFTDIRQILNMAYDGLDARQAAVASRSRFQGFGPIVGAEAVLAGWKGFHMYTRATGGLLTGRNINQLVETNDAGASTYVNTHYDVRKVVPTASVAIGAGWQYRSISLRGGYEITHYQGIFERPRFTDDVGQGKVNTRPANLTLEGLFLQAAVSY
ncbi:MAG: hypothetical protein J0I06_12690 [Planctomycetes bacterium]|nr:hypothetical protein [Planctomycetota bacterium]